MFMTDIVHACAEPESAARWFESWVATPVGHEGYLKLLGRERIEALALDRPVSVRAATVERDAPATRQERLLVLAARAIVAKVEDGGYDTLLAGIGSSHMAAWLAAALLRERGNAVHVAAELGFYGMDPEPGDVFLFSQAHASRSEQLSGILEILGAQVAGNARCLGVLAAAEIDEAGNINTTLLPDGRWVTGSGGANDIASTADCLVVAPASPRRYVPRVAYVTSPGHRVREVVSQFGRFRRPAPGEPFQLTGWLPPDPGEPAATPEDLIARHTAWTVGPAPDAVPEPAVSRAELALLRRLDPEGHYR
jgi:acyl CoA:acetate/3-ketoacid CoA transferase beta subunit